MHNFVYTAQPARVIFGMGTASTVGDEVRRLGRSRVLLLGGEHVRPQADLVERALGSLQVARFDGAVMHTPVSVTERVLKYVTEHQADAVVAVGGGSTTGLAKALAVRTGIDQVILPTTYAGSEVTPTLGETADGVKTTRSSPDILPETVIYDVEFSAGLPVPMAVTSAVNALAHAWKRCMPSTPIPSSTPSGCRRSPRSAEDFLRSVWTGRTSRAAPICCSPRGCRGCASGRWGWPCITSCVTFSVDRSIFRTPRHTL